MPSLVGERFGARQIWCHWGDVQHDSFSDVVIAAVKYYGLQWDHRVLTSPSGEYFFTELDAAVASLADFAGASGGDGGYGDELYSSDESSRESDDGEYSSRSNSNSSSDSSSSSDDESDEGDLFYCFVHRMTEYSINIML